MDGERRIARADRLAAVASTGLLEAPSAPGLDRLTRLTARLLGTPMSAVSLVTDEQQVLAGRFGFPPSNGGVARMSLTHSFCRHVVDDDAPLVVTDARADERVRDNPAVDESGVIAYVGVPIRMDGHTLGAFCVIDSRPRTWSPADLATLEDLGAAVGSEIALIMAAGHAERAATLMRAVLEASPDAYVSTDADGLVLDWNPAAETLFGWSRAEAVGADAVELIIPEEHRVRFAADVARVRAGGESVLAGRRMEMPVIDRHGNCIPVEYTVQITDVGSPVFHSFLHDISARRAAQRELQQRNQQLEQANLLKLDLMGMLSHDIGTPLAAITGYSELLLEDPLPEPVLYLVGRIRKSAHRIDELRHNVLAMCSLDSGTLTASRQPVLLGPALREAVDAVEADIRVECPGETWVLVNPAHLTQIVVNFITNAAKYGGGATAITVRETGETVSVAVHDEGPGVPSALRPTLFDRYTRAADTGAAKGHGLGLHIVASLAGANHGTVAHRDNHPRGSIFELTLDAGGAH
ncbi:PAS domain S-box protein [Actinoplanes sp. NPDC026670]|uniref:sensor histidine kinase n=1 Tax=Actinoplanes sp. NPDC026670 TaxID=3154700 RepID=UPI0033C7C606